MLAIINIPSPEAVAIYSIYTHHNMEHQSLFNIIASINESKLARSPKIITSIDFQVTVVSYLGIGSNNINIKQMPEDNIDSFIVHEHFVAGK